MTDLQIQDYIKKLAGVKLDFPFGPNILVYKTSNDKMFALMTKDKKPLRLSLRCDPLLSEKLREEYETVLPGQNLNKKNWNTILCTGQVADEDLKSLIILSYNLANDDNN